MTDFFSVVGFELFLNIFGWLGSLSHANLRPFTHGTGVGVGRGSAG